MWYQSVTSDQIKQRTKEQESLQEEILSRRSHHDQIRLNHNETTCQQRHIRHQIKIHVNGRKIFYQNNQMDRAEYIMIQISMKPQKLLDTYKIKEKVHNGYIFTRLTKGVCGIPRSVLIAHDSLVQHLWNMDPVAERVNRTNLDRHKFV